MALALTFGLLAAFLWGTTDFLIRIASRSVGVLRTMLYAQLTSALVAGVWIATNPALRGVFPKIPVRAWVSAALAAIVGLVATVALYRAFHRGRVTVVAPTAAAYGGVTVILSGLTGEHLGVAALCGLSSLLVGVVLVSTVPSSCEDLDLSVQSGAHTAGLGWALLACFGYGAEFWIQGRFANPDMGPWWPVGVYYLLSTSVLIVVSRHRRVPIALSAREALLVFGTGMVAIAGFVCLSWGFSTGHVGVVTAVGSIQSAVTVALACLVTGERFSVVHLVGLAAVVGGLGLIRLA